jgi:3D (Asp-Asp-Asp) domain-containing protein
MAEEGTTSSQSAELSPLEGATGLMQRLGPIGAGGQGKSAVIGVVASLLILTGGIIFFVVALGNYANQFGSVPGYASGGTAQCPSTKGWLVKNDTFDETGDQIEVVSVPDISQATLTETVTANLTSYCPAEGTSDSADSMEGGETAGPFYGIKLGIGAVAVPNDETRFPIGRTVLDIPGVGLRVALDHGSQITGNDIDVFAGWSTNPGDSNCNNHTDKWWSNSNVPGVKVYVFKDRQKSDMKAFIKNYPNQAACIAANSTTTGGTGSGDIVAIATAEITNSNYEKYNGHTNAWCSDFVSWVLNASMGNVPQIPQPMGFKDFFTKNGIWIESPNPSQYMVGDVVVFNNADSDSGTHIGIIESVDPASKKFVAIEGNVGRRKWGKSRVDRRNRVMTTSASNRYYTVGIGRFK